MWQTIDRPGYFGRRRDEKIRQFDWQFGKDQWRLVWQAGEHVYQFADACKLLYEESYFRYLSQRPDDLNFICSFGECIDNAPTNVESGLDYTKQESYSTHIQDIAVRNVLHRLDRKFEGPSNRILVIRSKDSEGYRFGPGNIPFAWPDLIMTPYLTPKWASDGSVESAWQSNKILQAWRHDTVPAVAVKP